MTIVGRLQLDHPALGTAGGAGLHGQIQAIYTKIGDNISSRILVALSVVNGATATLQHDFLCAFADLRCDIFLYNSGTTALTRLTDATSPLRSSVVLAATSGFATSRIDLTNNTGATQNFALVVEMDSIKLSENDIQDVDIATVAPQDGQALVWDAATSKFRPGASGDASFKLQSVTTPSASLKGGSIIDGDDELATYSGSGTSPTSYGVDLTLNLSTIFGSAPANAATYFLFIDKFTLGAEQAVIVVAGETTSRLVYQVVQANFVLSTTRHRDPNRYVYVGFVKSATTGTAWSGTGSSFGTEPFRRHDRMSRFFSFPETYNNLATPITSAVTTTTISHGLSGKPQVVLVMYFDGTNEFPVEPGSYVKNVTATQIVVSSLGLTFGGTQELRVYAVRFPSQAQIAAPSSAQVFPTANTWYQSTAVTAQAHGMALDDIKGYTVQEYNTTTGKIRNVDNSGLVVNFDATNFNLNWTGIFPTATLQYRIIAGSSPIAASLPTILGGYTKYVGMGPGSFATMTAALAASSAGDSILVARDTDETAELSIPAGVRIVQMKNTVVRIAGALSNGLRFVGAKSEWLGLNLKVSPTGAMAKVISMESQSCLVDGEVELATAQTYTQVLDITTAGAARNFARIGVLRTLGTLGAGGLENVTQGPNRTDVIGG